MEYDILMFLHNNPQHNTAAEIVKVRKSTKSHVSTSLKKLENEGLIERIQSEDNKKHIEIVLLDKAELIVEAGINAQKKVRQKCIKRVDRRRNTYVYQCI
ncbi:MarR family transcriptional regulator [Roseburia hominis]